MSGDHVQVSVTEEQTADLLACLARLWIENYETKTIALDDEQYAQLERCDRLVRSWSLVFGRRKELQRAEADVLGRGR